MIGNFRADGKSSGDLTWGAGPRAAQYLVLGAKSRALLHGRFNVSVAETNQQDLWQRAELCRKTAASFGARGEELALAMVDEGGKPIGDARAEVDRAVHCFEVAASEAETQGGEVMPLDPLGWRMPISVYGRPAILIVLPIDVPSRPSESAVVEPRTTRSRAWSIESCVRNAPCQIS